MTTNKFLTQIKLVEKTKLNDKYLLCRFEIQTPLCQPFQAGQYVSIKVGEKGELRSYSICSSPVEQNVIELLIDVTPAGLGTSFLQSLEVGSQVEALCPLGRFYLKPEQESAPVVLIGTGSGLAPLRSMLLKLVNSGVMTNEIKLLWGERYAKDLIWISEFNSLAQAHPNFHFMPMISRPNPEDQAYQHGRVTEEVARMDLPIGANYFLCGNKEMITEVSNLLAQRGVGADHIFFEKFY